MRDSAKKKMTRSKSYILRVLRDCASEFIQEPRYGLSDKKIEERSVKKWAMEELIFRIKESNRDPIDVIWTFTKQMELYEKIGRLQSNKWRMAKEVGISAADILNALE